MKKSNDTFFISKELQIFLFKFNLSTSFPYRMSQNVTKILSTSNICDVIHSSGLMPKTNYLEYEMRKRLLNFLFMNDSEKALFK